MRYKFDFLVIGSGVAGLSYALKVADKGSVAILTKAKLKETNTSYAQGGIASVMYEPDNFEKHIQDTFIAGAGINCPDAVTQVVERGPQAIRDLINWGVEFDRDKSGLYDLHREGGHCEKRILHSKDRTGAEIQRGLIEAIRSHPNIKLYEGYFAIDLITQHHLGGEVQRGASNIDCYGAYVLSLNTNKIHTFLAKVTMIATGGIGDIYQTTTNPGIAKGDGIAMVYRAKGIIQNMEFVQFHPTSLYNSKDRPSFLITEAMRGYGATLRTKKGEHFMHKYDERGSLAPRDIVARAIDNELKNSGDSFLYLDVTHKEASATKTHFPSIYKKCMGLGIDITKEYIPVVPAAHYLCGGIKVDLNGRTSINRLYAAGECSCTGLHGANRLASNSLLEAVVYADAAATDSSSVIAQYDWNMSVPKWNDEGTSLNEEMVLITQSQHELEQLMSNYVGIVRSDLRLKRALDRLEIIYRETEDLYDRSVLTKDICELRNAINVGYLVIKMAQQRKESLGLHYTVDYPDNRQLE